MSDRSIPQFEIIPREGIGPLKTGMTRAEVREALSIYEDNGLDQECKPDMDFAFGSSFQVEYDANGLARFIAAGYYKGCGCDYFFQGRHIGEYSAEDLFAVLAELDGGDHKYNDSQYYFPNIFINVWEADSQYDSLGGEERPVYGQVGVSRAGQV